MEKIRNRNFCLMLYPGEDETHRKALEIIRKNYDYACIVHDSDPNENGEIKKEHTHVVLRFKNAIWNTALAKDLEITDNYIEKCRNLDKALMYLIHYNDIDKYQYEFELVEGTLKDKLYRLINNAGSDEDERVQELIEYINDSGYISVSEFSRYCVKTGKWDIYRRSSSIFLELIREHNRYYGTLENPFKTSK